ncbi:Retrovirus-related Pol polyprotein from transposon TNT 1-94 [Cucumis melo var. makuwa]|uniref:Retrovirus-related Pol polyprotein from transposon TNT 1-94 n=1 Tax=Cucumis melo var. makuwa TaxID=1194695 RepID=A0A5D3E2C3_CUCMM|nr:Retrovirus-related Pol polyprotein from transposon TNT 1-94 [Cucumis melo var. makuwa]
MGFCLQTRFVKGNPRIFSLPLEVPLLPLGVFHVVSNFPSLIRQTLHTVVWQWMSIKLGREDVPIHEDTLLRENNNWYQSSLLKESVSVSEVVSWTPSPLIFDENNYQVWVVRMEAYMEALDIWEAVQEDYEIPTLPDNPPWHKSKRKRRRRQGNPRQRHEQRRAMRQEGAVEGALPAKHRKNVRNNKKKFFKKNQISTRESSAYNKAGVKKGSYPPCSHCNKQGHPPFKCWRRPDAKCTKCNQMGHEAVICRNKNQQQGVEAKIADQEEEEDQLFVATCFMGGESNESWLIDSGCTYHMIHDKELFKDLKPTNIPKSELAMETTSQSKERGLLRLQVVKDAGNQDIFKVKMKGKSFSLNPLEEEQSVFALKEDVTQLLHKRVGHYHHQGLLQLMELALDFSKLSEEISSCKACHFGKQNRKSFPKSSWRATQKLQLIHTDVAGIKHQLTAPYTPQQNGVSERRNRYIMEMTRCILHEKSLPKKFWAEAANTTVFFQNRLPTKAVKEKTPFKAWYGYKPSLKFLKVFGCLCFTHVPQSKRDKLDMRASSGVFIGYSSISKAYKIFQPQTGKIVVSRDVHFVEDEEWNFDDAEKKGQTLEKMKFKFFDSSIEEEDDMQNEIVDDASMRGTRLLSDIYERCNVAVCEPANYAETKKNQRWVAAMEEELSMIEKNKTWILVDRPQDRKVIGVKWVFRTKLNADGSINKHKARLVVKGYAQIFGVDYSDTFAPVARMDIIRLLFAIAAQKDWKLYQLDVKSAFLNGVLQEEIYVKQPEGCERSKRSSKGKVKFSSARKKYAKEILKKFKMDECKAVSTPINKKEKLCKEHCADKVDEGYFRSLIGCFMYLTATRPDILNVVSILSRFMHCASELHLKAAKRVIRYAKGTSDFGVKFTRGKEFKLIGFFDSDWGAQSTAEVEFIAATATANQALWLRKILLDLDLEQKESTEILVDNKVAIAISHNPVFYKKTKHFNIKLFFLREVQKSGEVILVYCKTEDQVADILTKPLPTCKFEFLRYFQMDQQTLVGVLTVFTMAQCQILLTLEALMNDNKRLVQTSYDTRHRIRQLAYFQMIHELDLVCRGSTCMDRQTFAILCHLLRTVVGLSLIEIVDVEEMVVMFLHVLAHDVKNRVIQQEFVRSGETVSRHFSLVLLAMLQFQDKLIKKLVSTYIKVNVPAADLPMFKTRKGEIMTNVLDVCDMKEDFVYVLVGSKGSAADYEFSEMPLPDKTDFKCQRVFTIFIFFGRFEVTYGMPIKDSFSIHDIIICAMRVIQMLRDFSPYTEASNTICKSGVGRWAILRGKSYYPLQMQCRIILACYLLHNLINREMTNCDDIDEVDEGDSACTTTTAIEDIQYMDTTIEWSNWRDE